MKFFIILFCLPCTRCEPVFPAVDGVVVVDVDVADVVADVVVLLSCLL